MNSNYQTKQSLKTNEIGAISSAASTLPNASSVNAGAPEVLASASNAANNRVDDTTALSKKPARLSRRQKRARRKVRSANCIPESLHCTPQEGMSEISKKAISWSIGIITKKSSKTSTLDPMSMRQKSFEVATTSFAGSCLSLVTTAQDSINIRQASVKSANDGIQTSYAGSRISPVTTAHNSNRQTEGPIEASPTAINRMERTTTPSNKRKEILPSRTWYEHLNNQRTATQILELFEGTPPEKLSKENLKSIAWAIAVVSSMSSSTAGRYPTSKRQRSDESSPASPKRLKTNNGCSISANQQNRPHSEIISAQQVYAVVDRSNDDGSISPANWDKVQIALNSIYISLLQEHGGPAPTAFDEGWHQGHIKLMSFPNERSADIFKKAIHKLGAVWSGAQLDVVILDELQCRPRTHVRLPSVPSDPVEILRMIAVCNPELPTKDWKIAKLLPQKTAILAVIIVNKESLALLAETKGLIHYGFGSVTVNVYKHYEKNYRMREDSPSTSPSGTPHIKFATDGDNSRSADESSRPLESYIKVEASSPTNNLSNSFSQFGLDEDGAKNSVGRATD